MTEQNTLGHTTVNIICSTTSTLGIITNTLSLSYFIVRERKGMVNRMFIALNLLDLLVCLSAIPAVINSTVVPALIYLTFSRGTAYVTCLLTVTRYLSMVCPFYVVQKRRMVAVSFGYFLLEVTWFTIAVSKTRTRQGRMEFELSPERYIPLLFICLTIPFVLIFNLLTCYLLYKLRDPSRPAVCRTKKNACITVTILATFFTVFTLAYTVRAAIHMVDLLRGNAQQIGTDDFTVDHKLLTWLPLTLNSAINPLVYAIRKKEMRMYWRGIFQRLFGKFRDSDVDAGTE